ncbi:MAG: formate dehydrogenase subunit delta [Halieaceae bacterium]|jgi:formate dehydrogenase subunit delta
MAAKQIDQLVKMANQIALNTGAARDPEESVRRTTEHLKKFWTPAMREQLRNFVLREGGAVEPVVRRAAEQLPTSLQE